MTVELIIDRPATGKTQTCISKVQEVSSANPLSTIWVIVPDRLQSAAFRYRLAKSGGGLGVHVGTFGDLYRSMLEKAGKNVPIASSSLLHFIIQEVVEQAFTRRELTHYSSLRLMPGFYLALRDAFAELKRSLVFPEQLVDYARNGTTAQQELANLYLLYQSRLRELGWADPEGLSWLAVEALEQDGYVANSICLVVVDGFDSFTGAQQRAMDLLKNQVGELLITFPGQVNSTRAAHRRFRESFEKLISKLSPSISEASNDPYLSPDGSHLEKKLLEPAVGDAKVPEYSFLLAARSPADEAREALRWIKARVVRDDIALSDCAIFTPNPDIYDPFLRANAQEYGIPVHFSQSTPLTKTAAITALLNLLSLPIFNFRARVLFNVLRSPYFDFRIDSQTVDKLEEISRKAKIVEGREQWIETWEQLIPIEPEQPDLDEERNLPGLPRGADAAPFRFLLEAVLDLFEFPVEKRTQTEWVSWLEDLLERLKFYERANQHRDEIACETFRETLRAVVISEAVIGIRIADYKEFLASLQSALHGAGLAEPQTKSEPSLFVGRILEARGVRYKAVALLGFSEGIFPQVERADPFLDEALRRHLGLESRLNREQAGLFYQAVTRTDQHLLITRPYLTESGEDWEPSPFWKDVQRLFDPSVTRTVRPDDVPSLVDAASSHELLFWAVRQKVLPGQFKEFFPRWENLRYAREILRSRRAKQAEGVFEGKMAALLSQMAVRYPAGSVWSASRLETYGNCPYQFYVRYVLGLEPQTFAELGWDASQLGSMLHKILEDVYCNATDPRDLNSVLEVLKDIARKVFEDAPREYGFRPSPLWEFDKEQLVSMLEETLKGLDDRSSGWTPFAFEQQFGIGNSPTLQIDLGGETVRLRGVIDRLDRNELGEIRVIDYKTGSSHLEAKDLKSGIRLQLPMYALAAERSLKLGTVVDGFYWKIQAAEPSALQLSLFKTDRGEGIDEAVRVAREHLKRILNGIRGADFPPIPPKGGCAAYCPAKSWCWRYQPGWGGAR